MKTNHLRYTPLLLMALFASNSASAVTYSYGGTGAGIGDWTQFEDVAPPGGALTINQGATLASIMAGNAAAPGGNTELFTSSESPTYYNNPGSPPNPPFAPNTIGNANYDSYTDTTTLITNFDNGQTLTLSSLTANDWKSKALGGGGLLDQWTADLFATGYVPVANQAAFPAAFVAMGGRQRLSDPNISYANLDANGMVHIGLAGLLDASSLLGIPGPVQISEIVKATYNGNTRYLYSFSATPSGVFYGTDGSYTGNYEVTIPEPSSLALLVAGLTGFLGLRRKAVKS